MGNFKFKSIGQAPLPVGIDLIENSPLIGSNLVASEKKKIYFENLDGLRFLCFLAIFLYHSFYTEIDSLANNQIYYFLKWKVFFNGDLGVNFFFVLSGFLITYLLIEEKRLNKQINVRHFYIRRILRIWPLYYFCVFFGFTIFPHLKLLLGGGVPNETANLYYYLTFTGNFDMINGPLPDASILSVLWSVAIEEQFYFVWPLVIFIFPTNRLWIPFIILLSSTIVFRALNDSPIIHGIHTLSCIGDMTMGALGAWLVIHSDRFKNTIINLNKKILSAIYILFVLIFILRDEVLFSNYYIRIFERPLIAFIIIMIILEQCFSRNSLFKMGNFKWMSSLGEISYGLYCFHFFGILITLTITRKLEWNTNLWQVLLLETIMALFFTIVISKLSYRYLEKPFLTLKDKFAVTRRN